MSASGERENVADGLQAAQQERLDSRLAIRVDGRAERPVGAECIESGETLQQYDAETTTPGGPGVASVG